MKDKTKNENNENIRRIRNKYYLTKISNFQTRKINDEYEFAFEFMYEDYFDRIYKLLYFEPKDAELFFDVFQQFVDNLGLDLPGNVIGIGDRDEKEEEEEEEEEDEKDLFPFKIVGDGKKKGSIFGSYKNNYLEIDSVKGLFKRYASSKEYPKNPKEIIEIKNIKTIKKQKKIKEYRD